MSPNALMIFVKNPIPGKTKTRLAASVGDEMALRMYHRLVDHTREQAAGLASEAALYVYYSDHVGEDDGWSDERFVKKVQSPGDLGHRMAEGFRACFGAGHERVAIIGSDCPGVTTAVLREAFAALQADNVVLGPATDGGFYLLGMDAFYPELFRDVTYSSGQEGEQTRARTRERGLTLSELEPLNDVDYLADWRGYGWSLPEE